MSKWIFKFKRVILSDLYETNNNQLELNVQGNILDALEASVGSIDDELKSVDLSDDNLDQKLLKNGTKLSEDVTSLFNEDEKLKNCYK